jgi:hypothetical protein
MYLLRSSVRPHCALPTTSSTLAHACLLPLYFALLQVLLVLLPALLPSRLPWLPLSFPFPNLKIRLGCGQMTTE